MILCVNCIYDCMIDVGILRGIVDSYEYGELLKFGIFNGPLIFKFEYSHTPIRMYYAKSAGPFYRSLVVWDTGMRGQLKYQASQSYLRK